jgi:hypothetical protein
MSEAATPIRKILLDLPPKGGLHHKAPRDSLSAAAPHGDDLWLAMDEGTALDRLTRAEDGAFRTPATFPLVELLDLPNRSGEDDEIDIEGLDIEGDALWLVGSHTWTRGKPKDDPFADLERVRPNLNRNLLACLPLLPEDGGRHGVPRAADGAAYPAAAGIARLPIGNKRSTLAKTLKKDAHIKRFITIPAKENGLDIEGIAVLGNRVFLGLRGPVLRDHAIILELQVEHAAAGELAMQPIGAGGRPYRKHLLNLGGNGVRDLHRDGEDILILAGPTAGIDGRCHVWRWHGACGAAGESFIDDDSRLARILHLPVGVGGDHPEGMALLPGSDGRELLVVYDSPLPERCLGDGAVYADLFALPTG